jgi:hypothetical protein
VRCADRIAVDEEIGYGKLTTRLVAGRGAVVRERRVDERLEHRAHVLAVQVRDRMTRAGQVLVGQVSVSVLFTVGVVADDQDPGTPTGSSPRRRAAVQPARAAQVMAMRLRIW